jgi:hypothetical protein
MENKLNIIKTEYYKHCPECNSIMYYTMKKNLEHSIRCGSTCKMCFYKRHKKSIFVKVCEWCNKEFECNYRSKVKRFCTNNCKFKYQKINPPVPKSGTDKICPVCNKIFYAQRCESSYIFCSQECSNKSKRGVPNFKRRRRVVLQCINCHEFVERQQYRKKYFRFCSNSCRAEFKFKTNTVGLPNYNPDACRIIDEYGKHHGYNFQHAENGGEFYIKELGYYVDGYDREKNAVIEVDEKHHLDNNGKLNENDIIRQKKIENLLKCEFIRIPI